MNNKDDFQNILITRRITDDFLRNQGLKKIWTIKYLWALGTGTVLTGFYAQWQPLVEVVSPYSFLAAMGIVALTYLIYLILVSELTVLFPYVGGPYAFARRGLGNFGGYMAGTAAVFQFVFGTAALTKMFKNFIVFLVPDSSGSSLITGIILIALMLFYVFSTELSAQVQFFLVSCGISGLILFFIGSGEAAGKVLLPSYNNFSFWQGFVSAVPIVLWYFFGLEGLSLVAEETKRPEKTLPLALVSSVVTSLFFSLILWFFAVRPMPELFFQSKGHPMLFILQEIQGQDLVLLSTFAAISLCAYISGINGLINGFSRQVYSLARGGYYPFFLSQLHTTYRTPYLAILIPGTVSLAGAFFLKINFLVYCAMFAALLVHLLVLISYYRIHKFEPLLFHFRGFVNHPVHLYMAIFMIILLLAMVVYASDGEIKSITLLWALACLYYFLWARYHIRDEAPEESIAVSGEKKLKIDLR